MHNRGLGAMLSVDSAKAASAMLIFSEAIGMMYDAHVAARARREDGSLHSHTFTNRT